MEKILRGSLAGDIKKDRLDINTTEYGRLKEKRSSKDVKRLLLRLLCDGYLQEDCELNDKGGSTSRLSVNKTKSQAVLQGYKKIKLTVKLVKF